MKITVTTLSDQIFTLDVSEDLEIENFKALCEVESGIPSGEMGLLFNGVPMLDNKKSLKDYKVQEGDMVMMDRIRSGPNAAASLAAAARSAGFQAPPSTGGLQFDFSQIQIPSNLGGASSSSGSGGQGSSQGAVAGPSRNEDDPAFILEMLRANPDQLSMLKQNNPRLAEAYETGNVDEFAKVLREQQKMRAEKEAQRIRLLTADPFDMEAQRMIAQEIQNKNIDQNMELAMETQPESFGSVIMLYINCRVNGHEVKAFVDSGAQATIMSQKAAERCGIMRLVDQRWAGIAKGVGTQKIIGRVHMAQIQIEKDYLTSSFSILEEQPMDMLLGLDMLKRHQCVLDLKRGVLVIGTTGSETHFLPESELPPCARLSSKVTEEDAVKDSAKDAQSLEDKQIAEAIAKSASESSIAMDTSSTPPKDKSASGSRSGSEPSEQGSSGSSAPKEPSPSLNPADILPTDKFTENDVQNMIKMGFLRERSIEELRKTNGDINQAVAAMFAKSLSESFNKRK